MTTEFDQRDYDYTNTPETPPSSSAALTGPTWKIIARLLNRFAGLMGTANYWTLPSMTVQAIINALPTQATTTQAGIAELATTTEVQTGTDTLRIVTPEGARAADDMRAYKPDARVATTANITLSGTQTVDTVALSAGNRVLVKNQTTSSQNGIYVVATGAWTRAADADTSEDFTLGQNVRVREGTQAGIYYLSSSTSVTVGTTGITYTTSTSSAAHAFWSSSHTDVDTTDTPADGEGPTYSSTLSKWVSSPTSFNPTLIYGLNAEWASTTQITIKAGGCWIPGSAKVVSKATDTTYNPTSPALAASTQYYLYASESAGTLTFSHSTAAPTAYMAGAKQGASSAQRYIDCFLTDASANIYKWAPGFPAETKHWVENTDITPFKWVNSGNATTETTVTVTTVPAHCRSAILGFLQLGSSAIRLGNADDTITLAVGVEVMFVYTALQLVVNNHFPLSSSQTISYRCDSSSAQLHAYTLGFHQTR